ncbi:hypothetical protein [Veronia nyctiphanis]|nr:hypothetical protein [Veronia nyctiphanis]
MDFNLFMSFDFNLASVASVTGVILVMIKLIFWIRDTQKNHKNKGIELIHNAFKEPDYFGKRFVIEQLIEVQYKTYIPFEHIEILINHPRSSELFRFYKRGIKFLEVKNNKFELHADLKGRGANWMELRAGFIDFCWYFSFGVLGCFTVYATLLALSETFSSDGWVMMSLWVLFSWILSALSGLFIGIALKRFLGPSNPVDAYRFVKSFYPLVVNTETLINNDNTNDKEVKLYTKKKEVIDEKNGNPQESLKVNIFRRFVICSWAIVTGSVLWFCNSYHSSHEKLNDGTFFTDWLMFVFAAVFSVLCGDTLIKLINADRNSLRWKSLTISTLFFIVSFTGLIFGFFMFSQYVNVSDWVLYTFLIIAVFLYNWAMHEIHIRYKALLGVE